MMKQIIKILHLEDNPFDVEMAERELRKGKLAFDKVVVDNEDDFVKALQEFAPDIILSDHSLPSFDSIAAMELVKQISPHVPVILVTATVSEEFAVNILKQGAADYILKTNLQRLPAAVEAVTEKANAIKEKEVAVAELAESYKQVRKLASHLQEVREEERSAIAREIHDELGQLLTGLKLDLSWLLLKLENAAEDIRMKAGSAEKLATLCLKTVRKISKELHPAILEKLGIMEAIHWQCVEFENRSGIRIALDLTNASVQVSFKTAIALFRIFQECLTNITRHANASKVWCSLQQTNGELVLTVTDNGNGFDMGEIKEKQSLGLLSMRERTVMLGGDYDIKSNPGKGTTITVQVPLTTV